MIKFRNSLVAAVVNSTSLPQSFFYVLLNVPEQVPESGTEHSVVLPQTGELVHVLRVDIAIRLLHVMHQPLNLHQVYLLLLLLLLEVIDQVV